MFKKYFAQLWSSLELTLLTKTSKTICAGNLTLSTLRWYLSMDWTRHLIWRIMVWLKTFWKDPNYESESDLQFLLGSKHFCWATDVRWLDLRKFSWVMQNHIIWAKSKVRIFWEGLKSLQNLHRRFDRYYIRTNLRWRFRKNSGLLRIYELY